MSEVLLHLQPFGEVVPLTALQSHLLDPKKAKIHRFFAIFSAFFPNIWPLAGPNIAKKGGPLQKLARVDRQTHFGTFDFWTKPFFGDRARDFVYFLLFFGR